MSWITFILIVLVQMWYILVTTHLWFMLTPLYMMWFIYLIEYTHKKFTQTATANKSHYLAATLITPLGSYLALWGTGGGQHVICNFTEISDGFPSEILWRLITINLFLFSVFRSSLPSFLLWKRTLFPHRLQVRIHFLLNQINPERACSST